MNYKLISFDISSYMGMLKKPDINKDMYLTYNMIHKPFVIGLLGALIGLDGFKRNGEFPEYYKELELKASKEDKIKIGICPLNEDDRGVFQKTILTYNNSVGYASQELGGNLIVTEQTIVQPRYRIFLLLNSVNKYHTQLYETVINGESTYIPYLGKNEFQISWINDNGEILAREYNVMPSVPVNDFYIRSIFIGNTLSPILDNPDDIDFESPFFYFENLPSIYNEELYQYDYMNFKFTNAKFNYIDSKVDNLYKIDKEDYVQLF